MLEKIRQNREEFLSGKFKCIPFQLDRLRDYVPGIIRKHFSSCTANSSVGKTTLTKKLYVYDAIDFAIQNNINLHILYFGLEESEDQFDFSMYGYLTHLYTGMRYNIIDFESFSKPFDENAMSLIEQKGIDHIFQEWKSHITFYETVYNSFGIWREIKKFACTRGTFYMNGVPLTTDQVINQKAQWSTYTPYDPEEFVIVIVDHISLLLTQKDETSLMDSMKNLAFYLRQYACKALNYHCHSVHQQDASQESVENKKQNYMAPKLQGLGDNKKLGRDYLDVYGLFNPIRYGMTTYEGYDLIRMGPYFRVINIIKQRYGIVGKEIPLFFDGKTGYIRSLPLPQELDKMEKVYQLIKTLN